MLNSERKKFQAKPYPQSETSKQPRLRPQVCGEALGRMVVAFCAMGLSLIVGQAYNLLKE